MAKLLCIDTAMETATVGVCNDGDVLAVETNPQQKTHASFLQPAIAKVMTKAGLSYQELDAIAVVNGPGSYTGLRVSLASAKGICYAANKPLLLLNTLDVMAAGAIQSLKDEEALYCPLIDARRNEVFTAIYKINMEVILPPQPVIIENGSFQNLLQNQRICFFGSGAAKCGKLIQDKNAFFLDVNYSLLDINKLALSQYSNKQFSNIAYAEPFYVKDFYQAGVDK